MKNIFKSFLIVAALVAASCKPDAPVVEVKPEFPQSKEYSVLPGGTLELSFSANMDWELTVPENTFQWFWIQDGVFKVYRLNGKAGDQVVTIGVSSTEEFDIDRTCDVTLKMGDKEQVIARLVRSAKEKTLTLYAAVVVDGEIQFKEDGSGYLYEESEAQSLELIWTGSDFRLPVVIEANHNWTVKTPEWAQIDVPESGAGENALNILGVPSKYPLDPAEGKVQFMDGEKVLKEYAVSIPGCKDILSYYLAMSMTSLEFSYDGLVKTSIGFEELDMTGTVMSVKDARIFAVETTGNVLGCVNPDWFKINLSSWNNADGANVLQERTMTFSVTENTGDERKAIMFVLPANITVDAADLFDADMNVKEEYAQWAVPVTQLSKNYSDYITIEGAEEPDFTFVRASDEKAAELTTAFGATDFVYVLTYEDMYASDQASMTMAVPFTDYKVFGQDNADMTEDSSYWLQYVNYAEHNNYGVIRMYLDMELPETASVGHVVFYNSTGDVLAIIECVSPVKEEVVVPPADEDIEGLITDEFGNKYVEDGEYFVNKADAERAGAKMYKCISGMYYDQYREFGCPVYILEYDSVDTVVKLKTPSAIQYWSVMPYEFRTYITLNGESVTNTLGILSKATSRVELQMTELVATESEILHSGNNGGIKVTLHKDKDTQDPTIVFFCRLNLE